MRAKERILLALMREQPDRVPLYELMIDGTPMESIIGRKCFKGNQWGMEAHPNVERSATMDMIIENHILCYRKLGLDMLSVFPASPEGWHFKILRKNVTVNEWGTVCCFKEESEANFVVDVPIKTVEDLEDYKTPDPFAPGIEDYVLKAKKLVGDELAISAWLPGIAELTWTRLTGLERFVFSMYRYPQKIEKLLDKIVRYDLEVAKRLIEAGLDVVWWGNDVAYKAGPVISPSLHRTFIVPRMKTLHDALHKRGVLIINHTDGMIYQILDDLVSTGLDALHSVEPQAGMSLKVVKEKYGDRIALIGNVDTSYTLPLGTHEDVRREVKECIRAAAAGGGYILSSSNTLSKAVPTANIYAMYDAGLKYGAYPIDLSP